MAHYSRKRPTFKSHAEQYKKSKWVKLKEQLMLFLSNVKRFFVKIAIKINEKGSQKLTIMLVPHNEKKIFNLQISNYVMFFVTIILGATIAIAIVSISQNQQSWKKVHMLTDENTEQLNSIEQYKKSIDDLSERFTHFKGDIKTIMASAGSEDDIYDVQGLELAMADSNSVVTEDVVELEKLGMELEIIKENIWRISTFIADKETLLEEIPSIYPLASRARISSPYGLRVDPIYRWKTDFHSGIDLATFPGTPIMAAADGEIEFAGWSSGYGMLVKIKHKYGFYTRYAHMQSFAPGISSGEQVKQGQVIGYLGSTGRSTGYHLHYEVIIGDETVNPQPYISMLP